MGKFLSSSAFTPRVSSLPLRVALLASAALASTTLLSTGSAHAQAVANAPSAGVAEIVVTALKRDTNIQQTPITISAVSGDTLSKAGVTEISDLTKSVPSLSFVDAGPSNTRIVIRGIESVGEPTVGLYYDEAPVTGTVSATNDSGGSTPLLKLFDVQRVEVLRGPQGTLYGAGSMAGTLRVIFNKPTNEYSGAIDVDGMGVDHGGGGYNVEGMINLPIVKDELAARVVLFSSQIPGYIDNITLNQKDVNEDQVRGGRFLVRYTPFDKLTIDASAFYQQSTGQLPLFMPDLGTYKTQFQTQLPDYDRLELFNLTGKWDLGPVIATATASYMNRRDNTISIDASALEEEVLLNDPPVCAAFLTGGRPACTPAQQAGFNAYASNILPNALYPHQNTQQPTFEFRLNNPTGSRLDWTAGFFTSNRISTVDNLEEVANPKNGAFVPGGTIFERNIKDQLTQIAGFGELAFHVTDKLTLTAGTRYFDYGRNVEGATPVSNPLLAVIGATVQPYARVSSGEDGWVSKFNASYQWNRDILFYASASQGFRPGGVNQVIGLPLADAPYQSDSLWDYEGGVKTSWFNHRLTFNIDGYVIEWKNMQVAGETDNGAFQFISNAGAAEAKGIEMDLAARPFTGLTLMANASFSSDKLTKNQVSSVVLAPGQAGDRIPYTPNQSFGGSAQYVWPLVNSLTGLARVDLNYVGNSYSEYAPTNPFRKELPSYTLTNVRVGVENGPGNWGVYLFVNNLFDRTAVTYAYDSALTVGRTYETSATPRTLGVNVSKRF